MVSPSIQGGLILRVIVPCVAVAALAMLASGAADAAITFAPDTVSTSRLAFEFGDGAGNVERLDSVRWRDSGGVLGANLALNSGPGCVGGDAADGWGRADSLFGMPGPVGSGTTGTWAPRAGRTVQIDSSRPTLCTGDTTVTPVRTRYTFFDTGAAASKVRVERRFSFSAGTPNYDNSPSFRAYVPELPLNPYAQVVHPNDLGDHLITEQSLNAPDTTSNWNGTWLALNDPNTNRGVLILRDPATPNPARIALENNGQANASSVDLLRPGGGWKAPVTETEYLCFYDAASWPVSQRAPTTLPSGCSPATVPILNALPSIAGERRAGTQLSGDAGSWDYAASFTYQWQRCAGAACTPIVGATGTTYTPTGDDEGKQLRLDVTATAAGGESDTASSGLTDGVKPAPAGLPQNVALPQVSGEARDDETLTGTNGNWTGGVSSYSYQWLRCSTATGGNCNVVPGPTSNTYKQVRDDVGSTMRLRVRATNAQGTADPVDSAPTGVVQPLVIKALLTINPSPSCTGIPTTFNATASKTPNPPIVRYLVTAKPLPIGVVLAAAFSGSSTLIDQFLATESPQTVVDSSAATPDATFSWNRQLTHNEGTGRAGDYVRDPLVVTLTITDTAGNTASTSDVLVFSQLNSTDSRANCPKPSPFRKFAFGKATRIVLSGTQAKTTLPCAARYDCAGRFSVFRVPGAGGSARRTKAKRTTIAASRFFTVPAGQRGTASAKLTRAGKRLLRGERHVRASLQVASVDPLGKTTTKTFRATLSNRRRGSR